MASIINASNSGTGGLISTADASGVLQLQTAGVTAVTVDTSQNLGLGVTPSAWKSGARALQLGVTGYASLNEQANGSTSLNFNCYESAANTWTYCVTGVAPTRYTQLSGAHAWFTAPSGTAGNAISFTQAMTLDASGNLLVGTTSAIDKLTVNGGASLNNQGPITGFASALTMNCSGNSYYGIMVKNLSASNSQAMSFINSSNAAVGSIVVTNTSTAYNTSSDYRLKENIAPMTGALAKVAALKPVTYTWKADGSAGEGFIAHELAEVCPQAVTGEKDAVDAEGKPRYQGIDVSFLVGTLTAAIQELKAELDTVKAELAAVKGN